MNSTLKFAYISSLLLKKKKKKAKKGKKKLTTIFGKGIRRRDIRWVSLALPLMDFIVS